MQSVHLYPMKESLFYKKLSDNKVQCQTCAHLCLIGENGFGICHVRQNIGGRLFVLNYGRVIAEHVDPIEKKPFYQYLPGSWAYSIASRGCNFRCQHCQNADISQVETKFSADEYGIIRKPEEIVKAALDNNCASIAYTYTEPTIFVEYCLPIMKLAREKGLKNIWVSNGYFSDETFKVILPYLDAINIDLKFFNKENYLKICKARLEKVLENITKISESKIHLEITTLIIPDLNDSEQELRAMAEFIFKLNPDIPWHLSAFHPEYKMLDKDSTPLSTLKMAHEIAKDVGLRHVYLGNVKIRVRRV